MTQLRYVCVNCENRLVKSFISPMKDEMYINIYISLTDFISFVVTSYETPFQTFQDTFLLSKILT